MQRAHFRCFRTDARRSLLAALASGLAVAAVPAPLAAQGQSVPAQRPVAVDWPSVARDARALSPHLAAPPPTVDTRQLDAAGQELGRYAVEDKEAARPLANLNAFMAPQYPGIQAVPVPVLAPVDAGRYLVEFTRTGTLAREAAQSFLGPTITTLRILPKTTGYDAILTVNPELLRQHQIANVDLTQVHLGGTGLLYDPGVDGRAAGNDERGARVADNELQALYPDLRRHVGADDVTYNFTKYGVPYFASIPCQGEDWPKAKVVPCSQVDPILRAVLLDLRLIGGAPLSLERRGEADVPRPTAVSPNFTFHAPGNLIRGTSQDNLGGVTERKRWGPADLVFPIKLPSAFANSQLFMHAGNCHNQKVPLGNGRYECRQNPGKILENRENHAENYGFPWRDTYCEVRDERDREPRDCPARKRAHEGQDIRPRECVLDGRCKIDLFDVVAVTTGEAWWTPTNHLRLIAQDGTSLYYMYMHMSPTALARAGMKLGEAVNVTPGRKVGEVGNWLKTEPAQTTAHLHFEIRKQNEPCGSFGCTSSPYWTLILAYERLINMRGTELP
jgi:hypothetical protein